MRFFKKFRTQQVTVKLEEVCEWVMENSSISKLNSQVGEFYSKIEEIKETILEDLEVLNSLNIDKKKADDRLVLAVVANKDNYVKNVTNFINRLEVPKKVKYTLALEFCQGSLDKLEELEGKTGKNFYVMKNLIGLELEKVVKNLRIFKTLVESIRTKLENEEENIEQLRTLGKLVGEVIDYPNKLENLELVENKIEELGSLKNLKIKEYEDLKKSDEALELNKTKMLLDVVKKEKDEKANQIVNAFSPLQKALKKYDRDSPLIGLYLDNPSAALVSDISLEIMGVLERLGKKLSELGLDKHKEEKTRSSLDSLNREFLADLKDKYLDIMKREEDFIKKIAGIDVTERLTKLHDEKESIERELMKHKAELKRFSSNISEKPEMLSQITEISNTLSGKDVEIEDAVG